MRVPHILLVNPWAADFAAYDFWSRPLGLLHIGSILLSCGFRVSLLDCLDRGDEDLVREFGKRIKQNADGTGHYYKTVILKPPLLRHVPRRYGLYGLPESLVRGRLSRIPAPDAVLMTCPITYWYPGLQAMIRLIREFYPGIPILLGGIYATLFPDHARRFSGADEVLTGPGEETAIRRVVEITNFEPIASVPDHRWLPSPAYSLYPGLESSAVLTSRGCSYRCPFCASAQLFHGHARLDPEEAVRRILSLIQMGARHIAFYDDALLEQKDNHIKPILKAILKNRPAAAFHTPNGISPRELDGEIAGLMASCGFQEINLSFESVDEGRQRSMGGKVTCGDLEIAVTSLRNAGFSPARLSAYILMGLPNQSVKELLDSIRFVYGLGVKVNLALFSPIPGTGSWMEAVSAGFPPDADPLLTNNCIYPLRGERPFGWFVQAGTLVHEGNRLIRSGMDPLKDEAFHSVMETLSRPATE